VAVPATPVHLEVTVPAAFGARARVSHLRVDDSHGDAYTIWTQQGMPASPSVAQLTALRQGMDPSPLTPDRTVAVATGGVVGLDFSLPRFGVSLVTLEPAPAAGDGGDQDATTLHNRSGSGCACRVDAREDEPTHAPTRMAVSSLGLVLVLRRRRARTARHGNGNSRSM
jgi:hypothetical protein